jgi:hypothetical protein
MDHWIGDDSCAGHGLGVGGSSDGLRAPAAQCWNPAPFGSRQSACQSELSDCSQRQAVQGEHERRRQLLRQRSDGKLLRDARGRTEPVASGSNSGRSTSRHRMVYWGVIHNATRRHSSLGYRSPLEFEQSMAQLPVYPVGAASRARAKIRGTKWPRNCCFHVER